MKSLKRHYNVANISCETHIIVKIRKYIHINKIIMK